MAQKRFRIENGATSAYRRGGSSASQTLAATARPVPGRSHPVFGEDLGLGADLAAMREAIATTRREMADLGPPRSGARTMNRAACELDAIASATEEATAAILTAVEDIEGAAQMLKASAGAARSDPLDTILERVLTLYETCNFQDITGQRIGKVLKTLHFVETRLDRVISAWASVTPSAETDPVFSRPHFREELAGPRLAGDPGHVSQREVDALFP